MTFRPEDKIKIYSRWCLYCVKVRRTEPLRTGLKDGGEELTYFTSPSATNYMATLRLAVRTTQQSCSVLVFFLFLSSILLCPFLNSYPYFFISCIILLLIFFLLDFSSSFLYLLLSILISFHRLHFVSLSFLLSCLFFLFFFSIHLLIVIYFPSFFSRSYTATWALAGIMAHGSCTQV